MIDAALRLVFDFMHETECPLLRRTDLLATGGDLDALLRAKLLKRTEDLEEILHHDGTLMAVRKLPHGIHGVAADPGDYFPPIPLEEDAVIAYEVNVPAFVKTLCEGNEISGAKPVNYSSPIYLGTKSLGGWGVLEVYLAYPNADMRDVLAFCSSLQPQQQNQAIGLLVPGPLPTDPSLTAIMDANSIVPIPLSDHVATATFAIDWHVAVGAKTPSISPGQQGDPLNRFVPRKVITQIFAIDGETIRRYDVKGQTPNGKPWHFMQDPNDKRRKLYNLRMAFNALTAQRMRAEYRDCGEKALAEVLDIGEAEDSVYQVRKSPNGFMHT
jgi:hypothetical protein